MESDGASQTYPGIDSREETITDSSEGFSSLDGVVGVGATVAAAVAGCVCPEDSVDSEVSTTSLGEGTGAPGPALF